MISHVSGGFLSILGSFTIHFAMLVTQLATVRTPRDDEGKTESDALRIYNTVWAMHLAVCATLLANHYHRKVLGTAKHTINICVVLYYSIVFICIGVYWVFPNEFDPHLDKPVQGDSLVAGLKPKQRDARTSEEWLNFLFWLQIEFVLFVANIFANILVLMVRACSNN